MGGSTCTQRVLMTAIENDAEFHLNVSEHRQARSWPVTAEADQSSSSKLDQR